MASLTEHDVHFRVFLAMYNKNVHRPNLSAVFFPFYSMSIKIYQKNLIKSNKNIAHTQLDR